MGNAGRWRSLPRMTQVFGTVTHSAAGAFETADIFGVGFFTFRSRIAVPLVFRVFQRTSDTGFTLISAARQVAEQACEATCHPRSPRSKFQKEAKRDFCASWDSQALQVQAMNSPPSYGLLFVRRPIPSGTLADRTCRRTYTRDDSLMHRSTSRKLGCVVIVG